MFVNINYLIIIGDKRKSKDCRGRNGNEHKVA